jgi:hypothetical protein
MTKAPCEKKKKYIKSAPGGVSVRARLPLLVMPKLGIERYRSESAQVAA